MTKQIFLLLFAALGLWIACIVEKNSTSSARYLNFRSEFTQVHNGVSRMYGFTIRCVQE